MSANIAELEARRAASKMGGGQTRAVLQVVFLRLAAVRLFAPQSLFLCVTEFHEALKMPRAVHEVEMRLALERVPDTSASDEIEPADIFELVLEGL